MKGLLIFLLICLMFSPAYSQVAKGHKITVSLKNYHNGQVYLGNYFGKQTYIIDSAELNPEGVAVFEGSDTLPGGIYFILLPQKQRYFEMLVDKQQHFSVMADTADHFKNNIFKNSEDNTLFSQYNTFLSYQQQKMDSARQQHADSAALQQLQLTIGKNIRQYREKYISQHPKNMLTMIFLAMEDPQVPETHTDSTFAYHYYKDHYWDKIDFSDGRIVRTPILETRLNRYFTQLVPPVADSVNAEADKLLAKAEANKEVFKFMLWWLTSSYEESPYMGMDAVFVHLVEKYYVTGQAYWLTDDQRQKIVNRAAQIAPNLIGNTAPPLTLKTADLKSVSLSDIDAKYLILVFWDPTCGHCQIEVPQLDSAFTGHWNKEGVKMVGVLAGGTRQQWLDFIKEHQMDDWINLWDPDKNSTYRQLYDVYMTPVVYLLDKNKKILAKKLSVKQLDDFLNHLAPKSKPEATASSSM